MGLQGQGLLYGVPTTRQLENQSCSTTPISQLLLQLFPLEYTVSCGVPANLIICKWGDLDSVLKRIFRFHFLTEGNEWSWIRINNPASVKCISTGLFCEYLILKSMDHSGENESCKQATRLALDEVRKNIYSYFSSRLEVVCSFI